MKKNKILVPLALAVAGGAAVLLFTGKSSASTGPTPTPTPGPLPPVPVPTPVGPKPSPFPPGTALAVVVPNSLGGMNTRTGPDPSSPLVSPNDAFNGTTVGVLQTGIASTSPASKEWWKIITPGGATGFASAVGPNGEANFTPTGPISLPGAAGPPVAPPSAVSGVSHYRPYGWR